MSNLTGGNFWPIFFCSSLCKDLSEMPIVKNSIVMLLATWVQVDCFHRDCIRLMLPGSYGITYSGQVHTTK